MSKRRLGFLLGASAFAMVATDVGAADEEPSLNKAQKLEANQYITHAGYTANNIGQDSGTNEHGVLTHFVDPNGIQRLVEVHMSSDVPNSMGYWQCFANCYEGTDQGWKSTAENVQISYNVGGERNCNRPQVAGAPLVTNETPNGVVSVMYGTDVEDPNTTRTYVSAIDPVTCSVIDLPNNAMDMVQVSVSNENDTGGSAKNRIVERIYAPNDETDMEQFTVMGTAFENGGGGRLWGLGARFERSAEDGSLVVSRRFADVVYTNLNIARQGLAVLDDGLVAVGGPVGNNRPPSLGVYLYVYNWMEQNTVAEHLVHETNDLTDVWPNSVDLDQGNFKRDIVWKHNVSNGFGEDTNDKGTSIVKLHTMRITDDYELIVQDTLDEIDMPFQTHATMCTGIDGGTDEQDLSLAVVTGSPSGAGQGQMQVYNFGTEKTLGYSRKQVVSDYSDSGHQSNIYGANPNNQGRNFFNCIGDIPNPGYGVDGGFRPYVKSFWGITMSGKEPAHERNSQFMVLAPASGDFSDVTDDPTGCEPDCEDDGTTGPGAGDGANEAAGACAYAPQDSSPAAPAGLLALGVGLALAARRRREEG